MGVYKYAPKWVYDSLPERSPGTAYVYGLRVIGSKQFRYVGSTVQPKKRLTGHGAAARYGTVRNHRLQDWLQDNIGSIEMVILKKCKESDRLLEEKEKARQLTRAGHFLLNIKRPTLKLTQGEVENIKEIMADRFLKVLDS